MKTIGRNYLYVKSLFHSLTYFSCLKCLFCAVLLVFFVRFHKSDVRDTFSESQLTQHKSPVLRSRCLSALVFVLRDTNSIFAWSIYRLFLISVVYVPIILVLILTNAKSVHISEDLTVV
jgi:hypothetical protein